MVELLFLAVPRGCLQFVIVVFPDHTHLLFFNSIFTNGLKRKIFLPKNVHSYRPSLFNERVRILRERIGKDVNGFRIKYQGN